MASTDRSDREFVVVLENNVGRNQIIGGNQVVGRNVDIAGANIVRIDTGCKRNLDRIQIDITKTRLLKT